MVGPSQGYLDAESAACLRAAIMAYQRRTQLRGLALARRLHVGHPVLVRFLQGGNLDARQAERIWQRLPLSVRDLPRSA